MLCFCTEEAWAIIQRFATGILDDYAAKRLKYQTVGTRALKTRYSFARLVPRAVYDAQKSQHTLKDGATATLIVKSNDDNHNGNGVYGYY